MSGEREHFVVFGFDSTHDALRAETVLLAAGVEVALIPTPRALGTLCGFAVRVPVALRAEAVESFSAAGVAPSGAIETEDRVARSRPSER